MSNLSTSKTFDSSLVKRVSDESYAAFDLVAGAGRSGLCQIYETCGECAALSDSCGWCYSSGTCIAYDEATYCADSIITSAVQCNWNTGWIITWWFFWGLALFLVPLALYAALRCLCARHGSSSKRTLTIKPTSRSSERSTKSLRQQVVLLSSSDNPRGKAGHKIKVTKAAPQALSAIPVYVYQSQAPFPPNSGYPQPMHYEGIQQYHPFRSPHCGPHPLSNDTILAVQEVRRPTEMPLYPLEHQPPDGLTTRRGCDISTENFTQRMLAADGRLETEDRICRGPCGHYKTGTGEESTSMRGSTSRECHSPTISQGVALQEIPELPQPPRATILKGQIHESPQENAKLYLTPRVQDQTVEKLRRELDEQRQKNQALEDRVAWLNRIKN